MEKQANYFNFFHVLLCFCFTFTSRVLPLSTVADSHAVKESRRHRYHDPVKLFAFGDSYADTGNWNKSAASWKEPYGITFPGNPAGRFSDGRVLTDYIASFLGIKSPVPYTWRKTANKSDLQYGMNFAYGGTGVFDTLVNAPDMANQISLFEQLLEEQLYTKQGVNSSIALVSIAGNDYTTYVVKNGKLEDLPGFTTSLVNQLSSNLKRIHGLGVRKIAVTAMQPLGCLPILAASTSYQNCSESWNAASKFHNKVLQQAVEMLNNDTGKHVFQILDLFNAFGSQLTKQRYAESLKLNLLEPCCVGVTNKYSCGNIDKNGTKNYVVCENPELSVFWDMVHPSQNGWHDVYLALQSSLHHLY